MLIRIQQLKLMRIHFTFLSGNLFLSIILPKTVMRIRISNPEPFDPLIRAQYGDMEIDQGGEEPMRA